MKYRVTAGNICRDFTTLPNAEKFLKGYSEGTITEVYSDLYKFVRYIVKNHRIVEI